PDEFKGDPVTTTMAMRPSVTVGVGLGVSIEIFGGAGNLGGEFSVYNNNYKGVGYTLDGSIGYGKAMGGGNTLGVGLNFTIDSQNGIGLSPSLNLKNEYSKYGYDDLEFQSTSIT